MDLKEMMKANKNSISSKIKGGFRTSGILVGLVGLIGVVTINFGIGKYSDLYELHGDGRQEIAAVAVNQLELRNIIVDIIDNSEGDDLQEHIDNIALFKTSIDKRLNAYTERMKNIEGSERLEGFDAVIREYYKLIDKATNLVLEGKNDEAYRVVAVDIQDIADEINTRYLAEFSWHSEKGAETVKSLKRTVTIINVSLILLTISSVILALRVGSKITKKINTPVEDLVETTEALAGGDLTVRFNKFEEDELGTIADALNRTITNLNSIVRDISVASNQVSIGSKEISNSSQVLAEGSTEQASAVEELTASVQEIASQIESNAQNAQKARDFMSKTMVGAVDGNEQMAKMVEATSEIQSASADISHIIKTIDEIAFQTNILALNAAVEAARAGQHGKGFAVVADEVRNLAVRSANAVKETSSLIENSIKKTEMGAELASSTAQALGDIVSNISEMGNLIGEIASASDEQSRGIQHINIGIGQVSDVVQTTSATAEESAAASQELAGQAETLSSQVRKFKLSNQDDLSGGYSAPSEVTRKRNKEIKIDLDDDFGKY